MYNMFSTSSCWSAAVGSFHDIRVLIFHFNLIWLNGSLNMI